MQWRDVDLDAAVWVIPGEESKNGEEMKLASNSDTDDVVNRIMQAVNAMILDVLAAVARKDYTDRRRRQAQGIVKAKAEGRYKGRPEDTERNSTIMSLLNKGVSWSEVQKATGCSRSTISRLMKASKDSVVTL